MKSPKKAHVVKVGSTKIPIYFTPTGDRERYTIVYYEAGVRKRKVRDDLAAAKAEATTIATKLARGQNIVLELSAADRESYGLAIDALRPFGIPLHVAINEFIEARKLLPDGCTLTTAVDTFARRHRSSAGERSVTEIVAEFLEARKGEVGTRQMNDLRVHLAPVPKVRTGRCGPPRKLQAFADRFQCSIGAVTSADIDKWLADAGGGAKRWNNIRASVRAMFTWAQRKGYLPRDTKTEAEMTDLKRQRHRQPEILSPQQLSRLLTIEDEEARLYAVLAAYTGARSAELLRLTWESIHHETGRVAFRAHITKTSKERTVPICTALGMWLAPYRGRKGRIFTSGKADRILKEFRQVVTPWPQNGLRHSYGSYRFAQTESKEKVSNEMGNSPAIVERHYTAIIAPDGRVVTSSLASEWFTILPARPSNVVQLAEAS